MDLHVQGGLLPLVRQQPGPANAVLEIRSERVQRMAITAGVLVIVILGLAAMFYSFNEAQRKLEYVDDSEHLDPRE